LAQWCGIEGGSKGTEGGGVDGAASREARSGTAMGVGDDDGGTAGDIEAKGGVDNRVGATGSGTATGVGDDDGGTAGGIEAEGGDSATSREAVEAPREVASMARHRGMWRRKGRETGAA
jgi:hypothetical protein